MVVFVKVICPMFLNASTKVVETGQAEGPAWDSPLLNTSLRLMGAAFGRRVKKARAQLSVSACHSISTLNNKHLTKL